MLSTKLNTEKYYDFYGKNGLSVEKFIDKKLVFSEEQFLNHLRGLNVKNNAVNQEEFSEAIAECKREIYFTNEYLLLCGHTMLKYNWL